MGFVHKDYLASQRIFGCSTCRTHLATIESMLSRVGGYITVELLMLADVVKQAFNGQHGRAYLFDRV